MHTRSAPNPDLERRRSDRLVAEEITSLLLGAAHGVSPDTLRYRDSRRFRASASSGSVVLVEIEADPDDASTEVVVVFAAVPRVAGVLARGLAVAVAA